MSLFVKDRVLVPIDFSDASFDALEETLAFVDSPSSVYVLHVLTPLSAIEPGVIWETINDQKRIENVKQAFAQRCQGVKYKGMIMNVLIGDPAWEIINYARTHKIELIVIPSHGRTGLTRFLMGSVAERVVRCSHCPVLVLPRPPE
jgi:nucleotide-binding universal stress UspA family protein